MKATDPKSKGPLKIPSHLEGPLLQMMDTPVKTGGIIDYFTTHCPSLFLQAVV